MSPRAIVVVPFVEELVATTLRFAVQRLGLTCAGSGA
jgi:hypothetical protein